MIEQTLKSNAATLNEKVYYQSVCALQPSFVLRFREAYNAVLRELALQYPNHHRKLGFGELVEVLEHFVKLRVHNTQLFNNFLGDVALNFNSMSPELRIRSMDVFAQIRIR